MAVPLRLPNLFLIGASKSGTSTLYSALKQHPDIYFSPRKEPDFFAFEGRPPIQPGPAGRFFHNRAVWRPGDYACLFAGATTESIIGEASTLYLVSDRAAHRIRAHLPESRLIAILRQPADRAYSAYTFFRKFGVEPEPTFRGALAREKERLEAGCCQHLDYMDRGLYHKHLSRYFALFPRERIQVHLFDDLRADPLGVLREIFRFLEVDPAFVPRIEQRNTTRYRHSQAFHRLANAPERLDRALPFLPPGIRRLLGRGLASLDSTFNLHRPPPLDPEHRAELTSQYREDILRLEALIQRDLSPWMGDGSGERAPGA